MIPLPTDRSLALRDRVSAFMDEHVYPNEARYEAELHGDPTQRFRQPPVMEELKAAARGMGLWNLFLTNSERGPGLTNLDYAPIAEIMGRVHWASEVFNCSAPDTGNMELLDRFGSASQCEKYLTPLLEGNIRSAYCMTEPDIASSDATNVRTRIERDGDHYVVNGRKWWITNSYNPLLGLFILMGKTDPSQPIHKQQSQIIIDPGASGITLVRPLSAFGYFDEPKGHAEIIFDNVRVPAENLILGEGRGFEISQGRLGPGRIHHCMRIVGQAERLLEKMCRRLLSRVAFGKPLAEESLWQERVAEARTQIEMCRLLTFRAAYLMDTVGNKAARSEIAQIKVAATRMGQSIADLTIQAYGAAGLAPDHGVAYDFARMRMIRLGDGPDEVHNRTIARIELNKYRVKKEAR
ncbi:acyl-CoA dehydrogenase family protein [Sphingobium sp. YR768]|uniref:acyl-CoA dehydrogenase family protein n=1 Tax=Sphingobium sp. YR768 TaxID=1884365 RepID=UPI0008D8CBC0|nr:acyl-CoA dehydrogenase family protein [Sphingobium sp. YR768]SES17983.1 acyl-CoA dehydrogenase [Sphingobium sp. YR768]